MRNILLVLVWITFTVTASAQKSIIKGRIYDSARHEGADNDDRYDAQANVNKFKGNEQLSFLGMSNNTNRQGFQLTDVLNFTGEFPLSSNVSLNSNALSGDIAHQQ